MHPSFAVQDVEQIAQGFELAPFLQRGQIQNGTQDRSTSRSTQTEQLLKGCLAHSSDELAHRPIIDIIEPAQCAGGLELGVGGQRLSLRFQEERQCRLEVLLLVGAGHQAKQHSDQTLHSLGHDTDCLSIRRFSPPFASYSRMSFKPSNPLKRCKM